MNKFSHIALALLFVSFASQAAEPVATPIKTAQPTAVATPIKTAQPAAVATPVKTAQPAQVAVAAPEKTTALSQQDKMRECNKQATGKKGDERKAFMKDCLASAPVAASAPMTQQEKMTACNKQATGKTGDERKAFMKDCLSK